MPIIITLARTREQKAAAFELLRKIYLETYQIDLNDLHHSHPEKFRSDILIAYSDESNEILGTMSIIYPNQKGLFPTETLFGFDLSDLGLSGKKYVEVGRFATSESATMDRKVVLSLFLGALRLFEIKKIQGWSGTVKDDVFRFLNTIKLPLHTINQSPRLKENDILIPYVGIIIGSLFPFFIALVTKDSYWYGIAVLGLFGSVQFLEGNVITPKIIGSKISMNSFIAILSIIVFAMLWGTAGMILALPVTASLKVIFDAIPSMQPYGFLIGEPSEHHITSTARVRLNNWKAIRKRKKTL